jgi:hypothetical protein
MRFFLIILITVLFAACDDSTRQRTAAQDIRDTADLKEALIDLRVACQIGTNTQSIEDRLRTAKTNSPSINALEARYNSEVYLQPNLDDWKQSISNDSEVARLAIGIERRSNDFVSLTFDYQRLKTATKPDLKTYQVKRSERHDK